MGTSEAGNMRSPMPCFIITIDTEGDNPTWGPTGTIPTTRNALHLPRFQALCERFKFKPVYLTNYEMAKSCEFVEFARDGLRRGTMEIGMHLHAWHSPPDVRLTEDDRRWHLLLTDFPEAVMREKIRAQTELLESVFGVKMVSHRAGRWAFNEAYARILHQEGYVVDCSVTPHLSWRYVRGHPGGAPGPDYTNFPETSYWLDLSQIGVSGSSSLLEVPMTICVSDDRVRQGARRFCRDGSMIRRCLDRMLPLSLQLRPNGRNVRDMMAVVNRCVREGRDYAEFMLHSSELMAGGSRLFSTEARIERLYEHLEKLFVHVAQCFRGATLSEYHSARVARDAGLGHDSGIEKIESCGRY
jgi:hypothetical protein